MGCVMMWSFSLQEDPNLLVEPNHVILNHLYALSIKVNNRSLELSTSLELPLYVCTVVFLSG